MRPRDAGRCGRRAAPRSSSRARAARCASTDHASSSSRWRSATAAASAFPEYECPWYSVRSERSGPRNASNTVRPRHGRRHRQVAGGEALAHARAGRGAGRTARRRTSVPVRPKPVATSSQISSTSCSRARARRARRGRRDRRAACPPRPARAARRSPPRARGACAATIATAVSKHPGSPNCGARSTGKRSGSKRSVPKPPSPTDSAPMVSPWYAPPKARNCVWPARPRFAQYWNAIFSACSTAAAPSDAKRKCGSSTGTTRASASGQLDHCDVAVAEHGGVRAALELLADARRRARARGGRGC